MPNDIVEAKPMVGILDRWVAGKLVNLASGDKASDETRKALREELEDIADELAGANPSPIELSLAESAALAFFALRYAEVQWSGALADGDPNMRQEEHMLRRINHAHRRYLGTLKALATVRKLASPMLQVNIGRNQTNVIAGGGPAGR